MSKLEKVLMGIARITGVLLGVTLLATLFLLSMKLLMWSISIL